MTRMKRLFTLCMALVIVIGLVSCNGSGNPTTQPTGTPTGNPTKAPESQHGDNAPETLTLAVASNPNVTDWDTNYLTNLIEEEMNVDLKFDVFPADANDRKTKVSLLVSSNSTLPDVFVFGLDDMTLMDYGKKGLILDVKDYYSNPELAPNFTSIIEEDKQYMLNNMQLDGAIYGLPSYTSLIWNEAAYRAWINQDWLDSLGLETPTTTDELHNVLKTFVEQDPNGNNKKDEIGIVGAKDGWGMNVVPYIMNAFTYANPDKGYLHVKDGKVYPSFTTEEWRQGLEFMATLVQEGLLSPLSFTQDSNQLKALAQSETPITGVVTAASFSTFGVEGKDPATLRTNLLPPLTGPNGECNVPYNKSLPGIVWHITKDCDNPELAFRVGDHFLSVEMYRIGRFGKKGENWTDDPEVTSKWISKFDIEGYPVTVVEFTGKSIWGQPQNTHWQGNHPRYNHISNAKGEAFVPKDELDTTLLKNWFGIHSVTYGDKIPKEFIGRLVYSQEEAERISVLKTAIDDYVSSSTSAFITGNRPLSDFDNYLAELDRMGLEEYLSIVQAAYDRN